MQPTIQTIPAKILVGQKLTTSLTTNRTAELWRNFMPRRREIRNTVAAELYSLQVYPPSYYDHFNPEVSFEKWAAMEVSEAASMPEGMERFDLPGGLYAMFLYKGSSNDPAIFNYIFTEWLPQAEYELDDRPHFELLGEQYKNGDAGSEEEIWIPVKVR